MNIDHWLSTGPLINQSFLQKVEVVVIAAQKVIKSLAGLRLKKELKSRLVCLAVAQKA